MRSLTRFALVVLAVLALGGCDWPTFRFTPAHTGYNPNESTIGTGNVALIRPTWNAPFGDGPHAQLGTAAVVGGLAYVGAGDGNLYVFTRRGGALQWEGTGIVAAGLSSPTVADGIAYAGTGGERTELWAWDAR